MTTIEVFYTGYKTHIRLTCWISPNVFKMKSPTSISSLFKKKKPSSYQLIYNGMCNKQQNNKDAQLKIMLDWSIFSLFGLKEKKK